MFGLKNENDFLFFLFQIAYFDCDNSDDSNSEYSFHLSAYEEDEDDDDEQSLGNEAKKTELNSCDKQCPNSTHLSNRDCQNETVNKPLDKMEPMAHSCQLCLLVENDFSQQ